MNKIVNIKEIMMILISVLLITISTTAYATGSGLVLDTDADTTNGTIIQPDDYSGAQIPPEDNSNNVTEDSNTNGGNNNILSDISNNTLNNISNNQTNNTNAVKKYNTSNKNDLPQTGIEDYNVGILLIICVTSAIYAYKKVNDYRNI